MDPRRRTMACSHPDTPAAEREPSTIVVAFELSRAKWLIGVCLPGSDKLSRYTIDAGDLGALTAVLAEARRKVAARCPGAACGGQVGTRERSPPAIGSVRVTSGRTISRTLASTA